MKIYHGSDRVVLPVSDYVLKFPKASAEVPIKESIGYYKMGGMEALGKMWQLSPDVYQSAQWFLLHGVVANRREARLATAHPRVVEQTHMLGMGAVNIQRRLQQIELDGLDVAKLFSRHLDGRPWIIGHMIENPTNFGISQDGNVRFTDGGSDGLEQALEDSKVRSQIVSALDELTQLTK